MNIKSTAKKLIFYILFITLLLISLTRLYNSYTTEFNHLFFTFTQKSPVQIFNINIHYDNSLEYIIQSNGNTEESITFYYPNNYPLGIVSITKGQSLQKEEYIERLSKQEQYSDFKILNINSIANPAVASVANHKESNMIIKSYYFLEIGLLVDYIGPPENYHHFEKIYHSAIISVEDLK